MRRFRSSASQFSNPINVSPALSSTSQRTRWDTRGPMYKFDQKYTIKGHLSPSLSQYAFYSEYESRHTCARGPSCDPPSSLPDALPSPRRRTRCRSSDPWPGPSAPGARSGGRRGEGPSTEGGRSGRWRVAEAGGPRTRYGLRRSTAPHTTRTTHVTQTHRLYITILYFTLHARCTCSHTHMHMNPHAHAHAQFFA